MWKQLLEGLADGALLIVLFFAVVFILGMAGE